MTEFSENGIAKDYFDLYSPLNIFLWLCHDIDKRDEFSTRMLKQKLDNYGPDIITYTEYCKVEGIKKKNINIEDKLDSLAEEFSALLKKEWNKSDYFRLNTICDKVYEIIID